MNSFIKHPDPDADAQASLWAAKLDGSTLSATDRLALDEWLATDPSHRALLSSYCQFSADLEQQMPLLEGIKELSVEIRTTPATAQLLPWLRWPMMAGAALTAAAAVALVIWVAQPSQQFETVATPAARRQTLTLADGSQVELNAQTNLQIEIGKQGRRVRLASGEAFFSVHKDASRPFTVETPTGSVRVTGTKFDVRTDNTGVLEVTVLEGSVQANPSDLNNLQSQPVALKAGDSFLSTPKDRQNRMLSDTDLQDTLAWRQGQIVCKAMPLREVLARFARYHGRGIVATPEVAENSVGGRFSLDDLDGLFSFLEEIYPNLQITHNPNGTIQVGQKADH